MKCDHYIISCHGQIYSLICITFLIFQLSGKIAWRLRRLEAARSKQAAEEEGKRIAQNMKDRAARARRKVMRKRLKEKKQAAMAVLRAVTQPETLFI